MKTIAYLPGALKTLEQQMAKSLGQFYDQYTVEEWYVSSLSRQWILKSDRSHSTSYAFQNDSKDGFRLNDLLTRMMFFLFVVIIMSKIAVCV